MRHRAGEEGGDRWLPPEVGDGHPAVAVELRQIPRLCRRVANFGIRPQQHERHHQYPDHRCCDGDVAQHAAACCVQLGPDGGSVARVAGQVGLEVGHGFGVGRARELDEAAVAALLGGGLEEEEALDVEERLHQRAASQMADFEDLPQVGQ